MQLSSTTCLTQQARQDALALSAPLANTRQIATLAAIAWAKEAVHAEKREARSLRREAEVAGPGLPLSDDLSFDDDLDEEFDDTGLAPL